MNNTILVTGGAGYIGSHTCKALAAAGFTPVVYDNLSLGHADFVKWGALVEGDVRDTATLLGVLNTYRPAAVVHFAALSSVGESVARPDLYYENNVGGMLSLLSAMRTAVCQRLVFSSTAAVYGEPDLVPITEAALPRPVNPYGRSKLICEMMGRDEAAAGNFAFIALRYFNASGADPDAEIGELRVNETHLIPRAMMALLGHIDDFQVFGSDFPTVDGTPVRDYVHVTDLAEAHVAAVQALINGSPSNVFNLGLGEGHTVGQVLAEIARQTGQVMLPATGKRRPGDPTQLIADATLAGSTLGFHPRRSDLETIVATAWRWHQKAHPQIGAAI